ncbi:hypothetical protein ACFYOT_07025 [Saccharothrix saharensis]|uniref:hypothetical protein n=1 Tax=Saccharothrix saharensis TaxID=571190 RepID=UPI0036C2F4D9
MIGVERACGDRALLDALAAVVDRFDPTPEHVAVRARAALGERTDAVPLRLLSDSVFLDRPGGPRRVTFSGLDLRLSRDGGGVRVSGWARFGAFAVVRWPGGSVTSALDEAGWFHVERVPFGPVRCVLRGAGRDHATPWFAA